MNTITDFEQTFTTLSISYFETFPKLIFPVNLDTVSDIEEIIKYDGIDFDKLSKFLISEFENTLKTAVANEYTSQCLYTICGSIYLIIEEQASTNKKVSIVFRRNPIYFNSAVVKEKLATQVKITANNETFINFLKSVLEIAENALEKNDLIISKNETEITPAKNIGQKIMFLYEIGVFDFIKEKYSATPNRTAEILSIAIGESPSTTRRCYSDITSVKADTAKNNPYNNENNRVWLENTKRKLKISE